MTRHPDWPKRWRVWKDRGDWVVRGPEYERGFHTWRAALAWADRMARTIAVTLPRDPHLKRDRLVVRHHPYGEVIELRRRKTGSVRTAIPKDSWEPLALALLAHVRKEEA